jgi:transglutaminase-like putative cysteine protease
VLLVPTLVGAWVGSTLLAWTGASREVAAGGAVLLFAVLPLGWELASRPRARAGGARPKRLLRLHTRLLLRACVLHVAFLALALLLAPRGVFTALSLRGDWMLPPGGDAKVQWARRLVFGAADCVEWAYVLATDNPYQEQLIAEAKHPPPAPPPTPAPRPAPVPTPAPAVEAPGPLEGDADMVVVIEPSEPRPPPPSSEPVPPPEPARVVERTPRPEEKVPEPARPGSGVAWPLPAELHPRVSSIHVAAETDYKTAAAYLVYGEHDPFQRIKALHDYVVDRVAYDGVGYLERKRSSQAPEDVFASRKAVCAGYANLFAAMAESVGEEVVTLSGESFGFKSTPEGHAWNAVRIKGDWYLIDATWNAGYIDDTGRFFKRYQTHYLFTPPEEFARRHYPTEPSWLLMKQPPSRGDFLRLKGGTEGSAPATASAEVRIRSPMGPRPEVRGRFPVELDNPQGLRTRVRIVNASDGSFEDCPSEYAGTRFACTVLGRGSWRVEVYAGPPSESSEALVAQLDVTGT